MKYRALMEDNNIVVDLLIAIFQKPVRRKSYKTYSKKFINSVKKDLNNDMLKKDIKKKYNLNNYELSKILNDND